MNATITAPAPAPAVTWRLTGKPDGAGECEHCPRQLIHRYEVTSSDGRVMIVGRGCLKAITGWTLTAAQAEAALRAAARRARIETGWAAFTAQHPATAALIDSDLAAYEAAGWTRRSGAGPAHEIREQAAAGITHNLGHYLTRRATFGWAPGATPAAVLTAHLRTITNRYPGQCATCGGHVAKNAGLWSGDTGTLHTPGTCP